MGKSLFLLLALMLLLLKIPPSCSSMRCKEHELEALSKFKHSFTADPKNLLSSWVGDDCCVWVGVTCDSLTGNVVKLNVRNQDNAFPPGLVSSKLSSALLELKYLSHLDLSYNYFNSSRIPDFIGSMTSLRYLNLSNAGFSGLLPPQLGNLTNLIHLDLSYAFQDGMPQKRIEWINGLSKLQTLDLSNINLAHAYDALQVLFRIPCLSSLGLSDCSLNNTHSSELLIANISDTMLANLGHLDLSYNELEGPFPTFVRKFGSLNFLSLADNVLNGSIPIWLNGLRHLESLDLSYNEISGTFPPEFGQLTNLIHLDITFNEISGTFPSMLGELTSLKYLNLASNGLQGRVPTFLENLSALKHLDLSGNRLTGWIPPFLRHLIEIEYLDISSNKIQGTISAADISNHSKLSYFDTSFNNINLDLSIDWRPPFQLEAFNVHSCGINTPFPQWLRNQTQIKSLDLSYTGISGELPYWIRNLTNVMNLQLGGNKLTGSLPLGNTFDGCNLRVLDVHNNMLSGTIPHWLQHLDRATILDLSDNLLSGTIFEEENSTSLFNSVGLYYLDLSLNAFSGEIRINNRMVSIPILEILCLRGNDFSGVIGPQLCLFSSLAILDLARNRFTGHIPRCLGSVAFETATSGSSFSVEIQEIIKGVTENFTTLFLAHTAIDLSSNHLVGVIPEELANISNLNELNLSNNHLTGGIPRGIGNLQLLESLDLSNNNLSGTIPQSLTDIPWLTVLNLSNNNLHGPIPTGSQLQTLVNPSIYAENSGLCGFPLPKCSALNSPPPPSSNDGSSAGEDDDGEDKKEKMWFYLVVMSGVATGFWGVVGTLVFNKRWRHAYFRFVEDTADRIYVPLKVRMNRY